MKYDKSTDEVIERRCPHGIRSPHECRECFEAMPRARDFESAEDHRQALLEWEHQYAYR